MPGTWPDARVEKRISALVEFSVQRVEIAHHDEDGRPRRSIIVMRGQVEPHRFARDPQVHRPVAVADTVLRVSRGIVEEVFVLAGGVS
jgi:hypothetical protein